jgi:GAF domain-containing protein
MFEYDESIDISQQLKALLGRESNPIANMANMSSYVYHVFPSVNWAGFYLLDITSQNTNKQRSSDDSDLGLVLGPFVGKPACIRINSGKGVCGTSFMEERPILVDNVEKFPGHIYCDPDTKSELVIPLYSDLSKERCIGVFDMDSDIYSRFDIELQTTVSIMLENLTKISSFRSLGY